MERENDNSARRDLKARSDLCNVELSLPPVSPRVLDLAIAEDEITPPSDIQNGCLFPLCVSGVFQAPITEAYYMTSGDDVKKVISVCVDTKDSDISFSPGDTIAILPCNLDAEVKELANCLKVNDVLFKKCIINVQNTVKKKNLQHIPSVSSLHHILKSCVDIRTVPKKILLRVLSEFTSDDHEKRCLQELCSKEGSSLYNSRILEPGTSVKDILYAFPSCRPPVERILELLPRLQPRPYSIASSPLTSPHSVRIVLSVVEHPVKGLCSGWLHDLVKPLLGTSLELVEKQMKGLVLKPHQPQMQVIMSFRKTSHFNLPDDPSISLILIGPGTGIAPFIGFLQHRAAQKMILPDVTFGEIWLFYGCRYADRDFLFRSDIEQFLKEKILSHFFVSFSRQISCNNEVKYVQDNIKKLGKSFVQKILDEKSMIYVCGDGKKMAKDVWETIVHLISSEKGIPETEANGLLLNMLKEGTYKQDIWM